MFNLKHNGSKHNLNDNKKKEKKRDVNMAKHKI